MQKSSTQLQWRETVRRFRKWKSCCHVIAIPLSGIAAPNLTVMQGFQARKKYCIVRFLSRSCNLLLYAVCFEQRGRMDKGRQRGRMGKGVVFTTTLIE